MKPWWLVLLAACSERSEPARERPAERVESRRSIDVTVTGAPIQIRGVELRAKPGEPSVLELGYRVSGSGVTVPGQVMCHVGGYNVVYPASGEGKVPGPRLTGLFRPDPFRDVARACEVAFFAGERRVASACYRDGELADGACPAGTFPPPPRQTTYPIELGHATLQLRDSTVILEALYTLVEPLPAARRYAVKLACRDAAGVVTGEGAFAFLPLERVPAGGSMFGPVAIVMPRTPDTAATCDVILVSRATTGAPDDQIHANYCATTSAIRIGACATN